MIRAGVQCELLLRRETLDRRRTTLIAYLTMKVDERDWHGVADAAMDLRELDAQLAVVTRDAITAAEGEM